MRTNPGGDRIGQNRSGTPAAIRRVGPVPRPLTRRGFLRGVGGGALLLGGSGLLAACGIRPQAEGPPDETGTLAISNWPYYIDIVEEDGYFETSSLEDFQAELGIDVSYVEDINDNDEFFAKISEPLSRGESIGRDIIVLTDWMCARLIRLGWVEQIDRSNVPNAANLIERLRSPDFDPNREYSLPWQSGLTGIGYDPEKTGRELTSVNDLFDPAFAGRVTMLTEMRDTMGLVMAGMGIDPAQASVDDARRAADRITEAVDSGQLRGFTGNEYGADLAAGSTWAAIAWSGDVIQLQADNPNLEFLIPEEGAMLWSDNMLIPMGAENKELAESFMDFVYRPEVAAKIESWVNFICPVEGAQEETRSIDPELADDPLIFPDDATLARSHIFKSLEEEEEQEFNSIFQAVIGA